ncbi:hypothetical protein BV25DRAFT_1781416, partial [Artomyces pyxidatus]
VSANRCPQEIATWNRVGRPWYTFGIENLGEFTADWWAWWGVNQPDERPVGPEPFCRPIQSDDPGISWDYMYSPGARGSVLFVVGLAWWRQAINTLTGFERLEAITLWSEALADVAWTLGKV